jgi:DNA-binding HxlR family transcriptional regulator
MEEKLIRTQDGAYCPVRATLALLGQKWVARIVYELSGGKRRFNDLAASVGGCNSRTLRDRLKELEDLGIVRRHLVSDSPPWVEYELTAAGVALGGALGPLAAWGREHLAEVPAVEAPAAEIAAGEAAGATTQTRA